MLRRLVCLPDLKGALLGLKALTHRLPKCRGGRCSVRGLSPSLRHVQRLRLDRDLRVARLDHHIDPAKGVTDGATRICGRLGRLPVAPARRGARRW